MPDLDPPRIWNSRLKPGSPMARTPLSRSPWDRKGSVTPLVRKPQTGKSAAKMNLGRGRYTGPDAATRKLVLERDGWACVCCGVPVIGQPYSLQHRKRRSQGGDNSPSNLVTVLGLGGQMCHGRIDARRDPADEAKGYTVRSWQDPALIPVMVFSAGGSGATVWLTASGEYSTEPPEVAA